MPTLAELKRMKALLPHLGRRGFVKTEDVELAVPLPDLFGDFRMTSPPGSLVRVLAEWCPPFSGNQLY